MTWRGGIGCDTCGFATTCMVDACGVLTLPAPGWEAVTAADGEPWCSGGEACPLGPGSHRHRCPACAAFVAAPRSMADALAERSERC